MSVKHLKRCCPNSSCKEDYFKPNQWVFLFCCDYCHTLCGDCGFKTLIEAAKDLKPKPKTNMDILKKYGIIGGDWKVSDDYQ